jgi:hypothetical protein
MRHRFTPRLASETGETGEGVEPSQPTACGAEGHTDAPGLSKGEAVSAASPFVFLAVGDRVSGERFLAALVQEAHHVLPAKQMDSRRSPPSWQQPPKGPTAYGLAAHARDPSNRNGGQQVIHLRPLVLSSSHLTLLLGRWRLTVPVKAHGLCQLTCELSTTVDNANKVDENPCSFPLASPPSDCEADRP